MQNNYIRNFFSLQAEYKLRRTQTKTEIFFKETKNKDRTKKYATSKTSGNQFKCVPVYVFTTQRSKWTGFDSLYFCIRKGKSTLVFSWKAACPNLARRLGSLARCARVAWHRTKRLLDALTFYCHLRIKLYIKNKVNYIYINSSQLCRCYYVF